MFKHSGILFFFFLLFQGGASFVDLFLLFVFSVCRALLYVHFSLVVTCWEQADLLALLYVMFSSIFVTFQCGVLVRCGTYCIDS